MAQKIPVVLNSDNKQHVPLAQGDTIRAQDIPLSSSGGNLLDRREDGLYYGVVAPADVTNLYVDSSSGDDTNPGTRALPLRTIRAAVARVSSSQSNTIWLRAGLEYILPSLAVDGGAQRIFRVWDDPYIDGDLVPTISPDIPHYYPEVVGSLNRPTLRPHVIYNTQNLVFSIESAQPMNGGALIFMGIHLNAKPVNDTDSGDESVPSNFGKDWKRYNTGMVYGNAAGVVEYQGCTMETPVCPPTYDSSADAPWWTVSDGGADGAQAAVRYNHCYWYPRGSARLMGSSSATGSIYATVWPTNPAAFTATHKDMDTNLPDRLLEKGAISGVVRDGDGKPRNVMTNFVL